jgi:AcrR family transcriptional regulator
MASRPPTHRTRPAQKRGLETREKLVLAAVTALSESGVTGLRHARVAKIAGVPQPLLDYHFKSLDDLIMAMVDHEVGKLKAASVEAIERHSQNPRKALAAYIQAPFELSARDRGFCAVWSAFHHLAVVNRLFADSNRTGREIGHERIQMLIQNVLLREGRSTKAPRQLTSEVATAIQALITGGMFIAMAESDGDFAHVTKSVVQSADRLIDASFPL